MQQKHNLYLVALVILVTSLALSVRIKSRCQTKQSSWAQQTLAAMPLREKIGQLCVAAVSCSDESKETLATHQSGLKKISTNEAHARTLVTKHHIGGIIFLRKQTIEQQVNLTNKLQDLSTLPLLVVEDLEWGLAMRLSDGIKFPRNLTLGALHDEQLVYEMGKEIGRECKAIGVHMNLAPVVDINTNPANPVINDRSFGCDKEKVARLGTLFMQGLQDAGVLACAKHFPGHGDTEVDSHVALPVVAHGKERLVQEELYPFKQLIAAGIDAVMSAHLKVSAFDATHVTTVSPTILTDLLKKKLGFTGLVITDALNMGALKGYASGELELQALLAGNDLLLMPIAIPQVIEYLAKAVADGRLPEALVDAKVLKILQAKEQLGLPKKRLVDTKQLIERVHTPAALQLKKRLYADAITILADDASRIPLATKPCTVVQIGGTQGTNFQTVLGAHKNCKIAMLSAALSHEEAIQHAQHYKRGDTIVVALFGMQKLLQKNFGVAVGTVTLVQQLVKRGVETVVVIFGSPYSVKLFPGATLLVAYEDDPDAQEAAAKVLLGKLKARGTLPVC